MAKHTTIDCHVLNKNTGIYFLHWPQCRKAVINVSTLNTHLNEAEHGKQKPVQKCAARAKLVFLNPKQVAVSDITSITDPLQVQIICSSYQPEMLTETQP